MDKFAFIVHPPDIETLYRMYFKPGEKRKSDVLVEKVLEWTPPFKSTYVTGIKSVSGKEIEGYFIACPLLPKQFKELNEDFVLGKIVDACKLGQGLGAKIIGLGGFTSVAGNQGVEVSKRIDVPVTTGNSYTAAVVIEAVLKAAKAKGIQLSKAKVAIIGATGSIGNACTRILSKHFSHLVVTAQNQNRLTELATIIRRMRSATVEIERDIKRAISDADIVLTMTSSPAALISIKDLKKDAIVCDVAIPKNISLKGVEQRKDIFVFDGGMVEPPGNVRYEPPIKILDGVTYGCIAETMILTLEERFESYSLGRNLSLAKIEEIFRLGCRQGFSLVLKRH